MSNNWKLDIDIQKMQEKEEEEYLEMLETRKYIEEMNDIEKMKELNQVIQDKLRNVKLTISKANLNQCKMVDLTKKKENNKI